MVPANGGHLYAERRGSGTALICIAGAGGDAAIFRRLADRLADEHTVISYDRRGNSRSVFRSRRNTLADHVADVAHLMDTFHFDRAYLLAHSLGSAIALRFALQHAERVAGIILHEPFWFPMFVRDPESLSTLIDHEVRGIQDRSIRPCGDLEARIRFFGGESFIASLGDAAAQRVFANAHASRIERREFSRWTPSSDEMQKLRGTALALLVGRTTHFFFSDVARAFASALDRVASLVPGGHGGISDHAGAIAASVRSALHRFSDGAANSTF